MAIGELFIGGTAPYPDADDCNRGVNDGGGDGAGEAVVVAADSGYALARRLGRRVDCLVGDLDSIDAADLEHARNNGVPIHEHPADKDATDLELAAETLADLARASGVSIDQLVIYGGLGGRLDHLLSILDFASNLHDAGVRTVAHVGPYEVRQLRPGETVAVPPDTNFSVRPGSGSVRVSISGARWTLDDSSLSFGSGRGLSNRSLGSGAEVQCRAGSGSVISTKEQL